MINHLAKSCRLSSIAALLFGLLLLDGAFRNAGALPININTASLTGSAAKLDFQLFDGDFVANNTATVSGLATNGTFQARDCSVGCSGGPPFVINDALGFGEFTQNLVLGTVLSFNLTSTNAFAGGDADLLILNLLNAATGFTLVDTNLDALSAPIPFQDALLVLNLRTGQLLTPTVTNPFIAVTAISEPRSLLLLMIGSAVFFWRRSRLQGDLRTAIALTGRSRL